MTKDMMTEINNVRNSNFNKAYETFSEASFKALIESVGLNRGFSDNLPDEGTIVIPENAPITFIQVDGGRVAKASDKKGISCIIRAGLLNEDGSIKRAFDLHIGAFYRTGYERIPKITLDEDTHEIVLGDHGLHGQELLLAQCENYGDDAVSIMQSWMTRYQQDYTRALKLKGTQLTFVTNKVYTLQFGVKLKDVKSSANFQEAKCRIITSISDLKIEE